MSYPYESPPAPKFYTHKTHALSSEKEHEKKFYLLQSTAVLRDIKGGILSSS